MRKDMKECQTVECIVNSYTWSGLKSKELIGARMGKATRTDEKEVKRRRTTNRKERAFQKKLLSFHTFQKEVEKAGEGGGREKEVFYLDGKKFLSNAIAREEEEGGALFNFVSSF